MDFILTDPPYITRYRGRDGRTVANDDNDQWLRPAVNQMHRVLKPGGFCVSFYGWAKADVFMDHEQAYLLAKGEVSPPEHPVPDVIDFDYTGNRLHPTQKPISALAPLIECFTRPGELVLDPFCGSGSTLEAARSLGRDWLGVELDATHHATVKARLACERRAAA